MSEIYIVTNPEHACSMLHYANCNTQHSKTICYSILRGNTPVMHAAAPTWVRFYCSPNLATGILAAMRSIIVERYEAVHPAIWHKPQVGAAACSINITNAMQQFA
jgi:hypothetical protein